MTGDPQPTIWYRYEVSPGGLVYLEFFAVVGTTPKGVWLVCQRMWPSGYSPRQRKWVSNTSKKRYAYPTRELAWNSFKIRARWRLTHAQAAMRKATALESFLKDRGAPDDQACATWQVVVPGYAPPAASFSDDW